MTCRPSQAPYRNRILQNTRLLSLILATLILGASSVAFADTSTDPTQSVVATAGTTGVEQASAPDASGPQQPSQTSGLMSDIKAYYTAPLRWDAGDWAWFGGSLLAIGASHHYDSQV